MAKPKVVQKVDNSASNLWGQVVSKLRTTSHTILYTACGDIRQVVLQDNELVLYVQDQYLYNVLSKPNNMQVLIETLAQVNRNATLRLQQQQKQTHNIEKDLFELKKKFGKMLIIK